LKLLQNSENAGDNLAAVANSAGRSQCSSHVDNVYGVTSVSPTVSYRYDAIHSPII